MDSPGGRATTVARYSLAAAIIGALGLTGAMVANSEAEHDHSDLEHHDGFTPPGSEADWPPRPVGANDDLVRVDDDLVPADGDLVWVDDVGVVTEAGSADTRLDPALASQLGSDWVHISSELAFVGKDGSLPAVETYFSYDLNQTVMVVTSESSNSVETFDASELQPIVAPAETVRATELGRNWLLTQGHDGARNLEGFGIRAFDDGEFYDVRMVYITFGTSGFADPEFNTLVDLTNGVVVEGGAL